MYSTIKKKIIPVDQKSAIMVCLITTDSKNVYGWGFVLEPAFTFPLIDTLVILMWISLLVIKLTEG